MEYKFFLNEFSDGLHSSVQSVNCEQKIHCKNREAQAEVASIGKLSGQQNGKVQMKSGDNQNLQNTNTNTNTNTT